MERRVLSAILHDREAFDKLRGILDRSDFSDKLQLVVDQLTKYYDNDPAVKQADIELLVDYFHRNYEKHGNVFEALLRGLEAVSSPNIVQEYKEFKKQQIASRLGHACITNNNNEIDALIEQYTTLSATDKEEDDAVFVSPDILSILEEQRPENLVRVVPQSLNAALGGGVPRGCHILVFARPEVGKSLVAINMACGLLSDGERVLYIGNEDPAPQMLSRFYSRLSGMPKTEMLKDPDRARALATEKGIDRLVFAGLSPGTIPEITGLVQKYEPSVLVLDQLTNLNCKIEGQVEKYLYLAQRIRALGKKYNLVTVSVCQAGDSATNKLVLEQGDVFYSNTGLPAQADVMIGVGANAEFLAQGRRMIALPKNKLNGNHEAFPVYFDPTISKVSSV